MLIAQTVQVVVVAAANSEAIAFVLLGRGISLNLVSTWFPFLGFKGGGREPPLMNGVKQIWWRALIRKIGIKMISE